MSDHLNALEQAGAETNRLRAEVLALQAERARLNAALAKVGALVSAGRRLRAEISSWHLDRLPDCIGHTNPVVLRHWLEKYDAAYDAVIEAGECNEGSAAMSDVTYQERYEAADAECIRLRRIVEAVETVTPSWWRSIAGRIGEGPAPWCLYRVDLQRIADRLEAAKET